MNRILETLAIDPATLAICGGMMAVLAVGTLLRFAAARIQGHPVRQSQKDSLKTWWALGILLVIASMFGRHGVAGLLFAASCLALREYISLVLNGQQHRIYQWNCYLVIAVHHLLILFGSDHLSHVFIPLGAFLIFSLLSMSQEKTGAFLNGATRPLWGLMLVAYGPSHAVMLFHLNLGPGYSPGSMFLYLIILTELNDIAQALVGRSWGRHRLAPVISPNKTWEGLIGGIVVTMVVATALAGVMTPFGQSRPWVLPGQSSIWFVWPPLLGLLIAVSGLLGDLLVSAIKRDAGVKDSGNLLPGQGGMLDRIDSLTLTAPAVYYFTALVPKSSITP